MTRSFLGILPGLAVSAILVAAFAAGGPEGRAETPGRTLDFDPVLSLFALRLAPPDPITSAPEAGLDAARAELAAGLVLADRLARGLPRGVILSAPAPGPVIEGFGQRQVGGVRSQGLTFRMAPGASILAPASGDILYAGPLSGLGEAVILQANPRTQIVLAGDFSARVREGESVSRGQLVGASADRGVGINLYLELRDLGRPIDPAPWLRPEKAAAQGAGFAGKTG